MASCPKCQKNIDINEQNFGTLFTCPSCQAVFFIDWSGQPEAPQDSPAPFEPLASSEGSSFEASPSMNPEPALEIPASSSMAQESPGFDSFSLEPVSSSALESSSPVSEEPSAPSSEGASAEFYPTQEPFALPPLDAPVESAIEVSDTPDFKEVVEFGNELEGQTLSYTVWIRGIEIADMRERLREALTDPRFGWDVHLILQKVRDGNLTLTDLSPAKAAVIINRIKYLGVDVSWKQNVLS